MTALAPMSLWRWKPEGKCVWVECETSRTPSSLLKKTHENKTVIVCLHAADTVAPIIRGKHRWMWDSCILIFSSLLADIHIWLIWNMTFLRSRLLVYDCDLFDCLTRVRLVVEPTESRYYLAAILFFFILFHFHQPRSVCSWLGVGWNKIQKQPTVCLRLTSEDVSKHGWNNNLFVEHFSNQKELRRSWQVVE